MTRIPVCISLLLIPLFCFSAVSGRAAEVVSFSLINADSNVPIPNFDPLTDGASLDLSTLPINRLSIRANVDGAVLMFNDSGQYQPTNCPDGPVCVTQGAGF